MVKVAGRDMDKARHYRVTEQGPRPHGGRASSPVVHDQARLLCSTRTPHKMKDDGAAKLTYSHPRAT